MADIHIERKHSLGLPEARKLAVKWSEMAAKKFDLVCSYAQGDSADVLSFTRSGVSGELKVTPTELQLDAKLGFLLGAFKDKIAGEIEKNLDALLAKKAPAAKKAAVKKKA